MTELMLRLSEYAGVAGVAQRTARGLPAAIALAVLAVLAGCAPSQPDPGALLSPSGAPVYTDGEYVAAYSATAANGWQPFLAIRVRAGLITTVRYDAMSAAGIPVTEAESFTEQLRLDTGVVLGALIAELESSLILRQGLPVPVPPLPVAPKDGSAELAALEWVSWFAVLARSALAAAREGVPGQVTVPMPGPYIATDRPDELGWSGRLVVFVSGERPVAASFEELRTGADGSTTSKVDDTSYAQRYAARFELTPATVAAELTGQLIGVKAEDADVGGDTAGWTPVDGVSGATGTTDRFNALAAWIAASRRSVALPHRPWRR